MSRAEALARVLAVFVVSFLFHQLFVIASTSGDVPRYDSSIPKVSLHSPSAVTVDSSGNLYFVDTEDVDFIKLETSPIKITANDNDAVATGSGAVSTSSAQEDTETPSPTPVQTIIPSMAITDVTVVPNEENKSLDVSWKTDKESIGYLELGVASKDYLLRKTTGDQYVKEQNIITENLLPCVWYFYDITALSSNGKMISNGENNIITPGCPGSASATSPISLKLGLGERKVVHASGLYVEQSVQSEINTEYLQILQLDKEKVNSQFKIDNLEKSFVFKVNTLKDNYTYSEGTHEHIVTVPYSIFKNITIQELQIKELVGGAWKDIPNCIVNSQKKSVSCPIKPNATILTTAKTKPINWGWILLIVAFLAQGGVIWAVGRARSKKK